MTEVQLAILQAIREKEDQLGLPGAALSDAEMAQKLEAVYPDIRGEAFTMSEAEPEAERLICRHDGCFLTYSLTEKGKSVTQG